MIRWREVLPRMFVDFVIIHLAVWVAYAISVFYQSLVGDLPTGNQMMTSFRAYYFSSFLLLSPLFTVIFFANGLYTYVRPYETRAKLRRFAVIVCLSLAVFISANFLIHENLNPVGRSIAISFALVAFVRIGRHSCCERVAGWQRRAARKSQI